MIPVLCRVQAPALALETTLLCHGVPKASAIPLHDELEALVRAKHASPALVGMVGGKCIAGVSRLELSVLVEGNVPKANTSNLAGLMNSGGSAATTVSATMEIAAAAGIRVFSTGGIGGVHRGYAEHLDVSSDLAALARFPVAVVSSGVKSILDVAATRETLEAMGIPVWGFQTSVFPEFYSRGKDHKVDAEFGSIETLALATAKALARTGRGVLIVNPVPAAWEIDAVRWNEWMRIAAASERVKAASGRGVTPAILGALHEVSGGATLTANIELVKSNVALGAMLARQMASITAETV